MQMSRPASRLLKGLGFAAPGLALLTIVIMSVAVGQSDPTTNETDATLAPTYVITGPIETSRLYADNSEVAIQTSDRWRFMCGSQTAGLSPADLQAFAEAHQAAMASGPTILIDNGRDAGQLDIQFSISASVPSAARDALAVGEAYLEELFGDDIVVRITVDFQDMGNNNVIGATGSAFVEDVNYTVSRAGLVSGMDSDDEVQDYLPEGTTIPVRYNGGSGTVTNERYINWTKASYRATVGTVSGNAAGMTFNTRFAFDYDPSNGIASGQMSFVDVLIHEIGHALGFVSGADWQGSAMASLDIYRFQRTDGSFNYNPDTLEDFRTTPRLVDYNTPDDAHISDTITSGEYRMSDGDPWQASHFREQGQWIGLMDPAFSTGETHYPNYFAVSDKSMFDAIGYDYPPCDIPKFLQQPENQSGCEGDTLELTVAVDIAQPGYQWYDGSTPLDDDGVHIFGTKTATLKLMDVTVAHASNAYWCHVTNLLDACEASSQYASVTVSEAIEITAQPQNLNLNPGENAVFEVTATGGAPLTYRWRKDGTPLQNGGNIYFADTRKLVLLYVSPADNGLYDCVVTNPCGDTISDAATLTVRPYQLAGDTNCDQVVDFLDINPFIVALTEGEAGYYQKYPDCNFLNADADLNGLVDFGDINPFIVLLQN